jgi:hypothetical protein
MICYLFQKVNGEVTSHMPHSWPATSSNENGVMVTPISQYYRSRTVQALIELEGTGTDSVL